MRQANIAVLGCGMIVRQGHLPGLQANGRAAVPVIYGPDTPNSHDLAKTFGIPRLVHSIDEALATPGLDGVVIALPNYQHAPAAMSAIAAGLPMLLEKPIASDIQAARDVVAAAEAAGVRIAMSLPQRQRPSLVHLKELVSSGSFGRIQSIDIRMTRRAGIPGFGGWFTRRELAGGGVLTDLAPHVIDTAFWLAGCSEASAVSARLWSTHGPAGRGLGDWGNPRRASAISQPAFDVEDRASFEFDLSNETRVTGEVAWAVYGGDENRIRIVGDRGGAEYCPDRYGSDTPLRLFGDGVDGRPVDARHPIRADHDDLEPAWAAVAATFVDDLGHHEPRLVSGVEALVAANLIFQIYESGF